LEDHGKKEKSHPTVSYWRRRTPVLESA
jgi:hypothetical protein